MAEKSPTPEGAPAEAPAGGGGGGIKPFIPLLANLILMPVLAYLMVVLVLVPKLQHSVGGEAAAEGKEEAPAKKEASAHGGEGKSEKSEGKEEKGGEGKNEALKGGKYSAALGKKVIVNVAKTQMTRFLLAEIVVVSGKSNIKDLVEAHEPELRNAAINVMCTKTIADLELPTARNLIRSELMSNFGPILGDGVVKDIYLTDFAVQ